MRLNVIRAALRRATPVHAAVFLALAGISLTPNASAQYGPQTLTLGASQVGFHVHDKLAAVPMKLGAEGPHYIARFEPSDEGDYIYGKFGKYAWQLYVLDFQSEALRKQGESAPETGTDGKPVAPEDAGAKVREMMLDKSRAANFREWVKEKDPGRSGGRRFVVEGKEKKGSSKRPGYAWWEYYDTQQMSIGGKDEEMIWYKTACVYDLGDREVTLLVVLPVKKGNKPDSKYMTIAKRMLTSLQVMDADEDDGIDEDRDEFADTPERQASLKRLKDNVGDLKNWDYFTSPNYLFTYSWHPEKRAKKRDSYRFAREMEARLEEAREKFDEFYPPHENVGNAYSVIRICFDYDEFRKYGDTPYGVVGWFSPGSKELVIYYDEGKEFLKNEDEMLAVCYHEAWHQYSDAYFPDVELHRWFDEGLAEYFGSLRKKGKRWSHVYHDGRLDSLARQKREGQLIPSAEIVTWDRAKFYGPRAADHYAQAYAMVDFLVRGKEVLGRRWNDRWSEILPIYAQVCLEKKSDKKAVEEAFAGVDFAEFEAGWNEWWERDNIKRK